jgi:PAS domain-containing protein
MDAMPTPALLLDRDHRFVAVNDALARSIGAAARS